MAAQIRILYFDRQGKIIHHETTQEAYTRENIALWEALLNDRNVEQSCEFDQFQLVPWDPEAMDSRSPLEYNLDMADAINRELDRLGWSSDMAPEGTSCLYAFATEEAGIIVVSDPQEETAFQSEGVLRALCDLQPPVTYDEVWQVMLPHIAA